jgi:hypothetical protein
VERSCLSRYRIYETIGSLALKNSISALPNKLSQSIHAAMKKRHYSVWGFIGHTTISTGACAVLIAAMFFASTVLKMPNSSPLSVWEQQQSQRSQRMNTIARLQFHIERGHPPQDGAELVKKGYLPKSAIRAETHSTGSF